MKNVLSLLAAVFLAVCLHAEMNLNRTIPQIELRDGTILKNVKIVSYAENALMAKWDGGRGTIAYADLPNEVQAAIANRGLKLASAPASSVQGAEETIKGRYPQHLKGRISEKSNGLLVVRCEGGGRQAYGQSNYPQTNRGFVPPSSDNSNRGNGMGAIYTAPVAEAPIFAAVEGTVCIKNYPGFYQVGVGDEVEFDVVRVGDVDFANQTLPLFRPH